VALAGYEPAARTGRRPHRGLQTIYHPNPGGTPVLFSFLHPLWYIGLFRWLRARRSPCQEVAFEPRLIGRFQSDRRATVGYLETVRWCTPKALGRLAAVLGTVTVRIEPGVVTVESPGPSESRPYKVFARGEHSVTIECVTERAGGEPAKPWRWTVDFVADGYWTCTQFWWLWWYREKFTRIDDPTPLTTPAPA
jgi:hypothetical protein